MKASPATLKATATRRRSTVSNAFQASKEVCELLQTMGEIETVRRGTMLFRKGDPLKGVFVVLQGRVALSAGDDPVRITRIAGKGSLLGLPATVRNRRYSLTAEAVTDTEVCLVPPERFREALATNPLLGLAVVAILSEEVAGLRRFVVHKL